MKLSTDGFVFEVDARNDPLVVALEVPARGVCSRSLNESYHDRPKYEEVENYKKCTNLVHWVKSKYKKAKGSKLAL